MADWNRASFETALIEEMRAHGGAVTSGPLAGHPLLVMTSTGARTGRARRAILTYSRDGDAYVVAGSAGGSRRDPAWVRNLRANARVSVEVGTAIFDATASIADGDDRERLWRRHVEALPHFADYEAKAGRRIPMVRLHRLD
jgi:deazaflavin-dependent oxidoreductase (nitroreductase family)